MWIKHIRNLVSKAQYERRRWVFNPMNESCVIAMTAIFVCLFSEGHQQSVSKQHSFCFWWITLGCQGVFQHKHKPSLFMISVSHWPRKKKYHLVLIILKAFLGLFQSLMTTCWYWKHTKTQALTDTLSSLLLWAKNTDVFQLLAIISVFFAHNN